MRAFLTAGLRPAVLVCVVVLFLTLVIGAVVETRPAALANGAATSCLRAGDTLMAASQHVRVVRHRLRPRGDYARQQFVACWTPTGRRTTIGVAEQAPDDVIVRTSVRVIDDRYAGIVMHTFAGPAEEMRASLFDIRKGRKVHDTRACGELSNRHEGIEEAVFLPGGGVAFSCEPLLLYPRASSRKLKELEPRGTIVANLAVSEKSFWFGAVLYWRVENEDGDTIAVKSY